MLETIRNERIQKMLKLRELNKEPYPSKVQRTHTNKEIIDTFEMLENDEVIVAYGGRGGRGNTAFKTPSNPAPNFSENGESIALNVLDRLGVAPNGYYDYLTGEFLNITNSSIHMNKLSILWVKVK